MINFNIYINYQELSTLMLLVASPSLRKFLLNKLYLIKSAYVK